MEREHRRVLILDENFNPFELWVIGALFLSASLFILGLAPPPSSVEATVTSEFWRWLWHIQIFTGSLCTLVSTFALRRFPVLRKYLQIFGYIEIAAGTFVYAGAVFFYAGSAGYGAGLLIGCVGLSCLFRAFQVWKQLKLLLSKYEEWSQ